MAKPTVWRMVTQKLQCILLFKGTDFSKWQELGRKDFNHFLPYSVLFQVLNIIWSSLCPPSFPFVMWGWCQNYMPAFLSLPWLQEQLSPYGRDQEMPCLLVNSYYLQVIYEEHSSLHHFSSGHIQRISLFENQST